eukprot:IDg21558t1
MDHPQNSSRITVRSSEQMFQAHARYMGVTICYNNVSSADEWPSRAVQPHTPFWPSCFCSRPPPELARVCTSPSICVQYASAYELGVAPFDLILSRPPGPVTLKKEASVTEALPPAQEKQRFLSQLRRMVPKVRDHLGRAQHRCKRNFDKRVAPIRTIHIGQSVYLERQGLQETDAPCVKRRHKLQARADGPYKVIKEGTNTVTILRDGLEEVVSRDRIAVAPPRLPSPDPSSDAPADVHQAPDDDHSA